MLPAPSSTEVRIARRAAALTQAQAAALVGASAKSWQQWESGLARMHPGLWELFRIKAKPVLFTLEQMQARIEEQLRASGQIT